MCHAFQGLVAWTEAGAWGHAREGVQTGWDGNFLGIRLKRYLDPKPGEHRTPG